MKFFEAFTDLHQHLEVLGFYYEGLFLVLIRPLKSILVDERMRQTCEHTKARSHRRFDLSVKLELEKSEGGKIEFVQSRA